MQTWLMTILGSLGGRKFVVTVGTIVWQAIQTAQGQPIQWGAVAMAVVYVAAQAYIDNASQGQTSTSFQVMKNNPTDLQARDLQNQQIGASKVVEALRKQQAEKEAKFVAELNEAKDKVVSINDAPNPN